MHLNFFKGKDEIASAVIGFYEKRTTNVFIENLQTNCCYCRQLFDRTSKLILLVTLHDIVLACPWV